MNTDTLKISIVQRIFNLSDEGILKKINELLRSENIVGYKPDGTPISESQYITEMDEQQQRIQNGTAKFHTSDEVRKKIMDENNLGG